MRSFFCFALALTMLGACSRVSPGTKAAEQPSSQQPPAGTQAGSPSTAKTVSGTVVESIDTASYTYVRVKTGEGEVWAATAQFKVAPGDRVVVPLEMPMRDFHSPTLKRDFPLIYFTSHIDREGETKPTLMPGHEPAQASPMGGHPPVGNAPPPGAASPVVVTKIEPPAGGLSIADVWARRTALAGKTVTVRGTVVKFNGGILDTNWLHIQDGSGDAKAGTHDLTITSQGVAKVGDVITATGRLTTNKDLGSGYSYGAIIENATIASK